MKLSLSIFGYMLIISVVFEVKISKLLGTMIDAKGRWITTCKVVRSPQSNWREPVRRILISRVRADRPRIVIEIVVPSDSYEDASSSSI
jgi:hypothetical protein